MRKENQLKHKTKCVTDLLVTVRTLSMKDYTCHYGLSTQKSNVHLVFIKNNENLKYFLHVTGYLNIKKSYPICMFVVMASRNVSIYISCFYKDSNLHTYEIISYVFRLIYVAMYNN